MTALMTCIHKYKSGNRIIGYQLADNNLSRFITPDLLVLFYHKGELELTNLTVTKEGKIINKNYKPSTLDTWPEFKNKNTIRNYIAKMRLMGKVEKVTSGYNDAVYFIHITDKEHILYIPSNVKEVFSYTGVVLRNLRGNLRVAGGSGLTNIAGLFEKCVLSYIDFSLFDTKNVTSMRNAFQDCHVKALDLHYFNTTKLTDTTEMFSNCHSNIIDLSSFTTPNLMKTEGMFKGCCVDILDIRTLHTHKVVNMMHMFRLCTASQIKFGKYFDTSNVALMSYMFVGVTLEELDLSFFNTSKVRKPLEMFSHSKIKKLDISSFDFQSTYFGDLSRFLRGVSHLEEIVLNEKTYKLLKPHIEQINVDRKRELTIQTKQPLLVVIK